MIHPAGPPGLIIAAPRSGAGKTTVTLGLLRALRRRDLAVQPFKCGPDYIDPAFHEVAAGRPSYNLDSWAMGAGLIATLAATASMDAEISIAEGVMGLFDGAAARGQSGSGATADLASLLGWPVVLVLDVSGQTETAAAVALGCARYRDDIEIAGVILNRVASARHLALIAPAFERIKLPVLGRCCVMNGSLYRNGISALFRRGKSRRSTSIWTDLPTSSTLPLMSMRSDDRRGPRRFHLQPATSR